MHERKIAVIAVHGVGDPVCGVMPLKIAQQLQRANPKDYRHFETTAITIAVTAAELRIDPDKVVEETPVQGFLPAGAGSRLVAQAELSTPSAPQPASADLVFTRTLLEGGAHLRGDYQSVRIDSSFDRGPVRTTVQIYEMFWADLSHGAMSSAFAVFSQLMQVFLHVASLGRGTLVSISAAMSPQEQKATRISTIYRTSAFGYWLLAVPIVLGNLMFVMFGILLPTLLISDPSPSEKVGVAVVIGLLCAVLSAALVRKNLREGAPSAWIVKYGASLVAAIGAVAVIAMLMWRWESALAPRVVLFGFEAVLLAVAATIVMRRYDKSRPGVRKYWNLMLWGVGAWGALCAVYVAMFFKAPANPRVDLVLQWFAFWVEGCLIVLALTWVLLYMVNFALLALSVRAKRISPPISSEVRKAIDTSLMAASIPASMSMSVILFMWIVYAGLLARVPNVATWQVVSMMAAPGQTETVLCMINRLIAQSAGAGFLPYLASIAIFFLCAMVALVPSLIAEARPPTCAPASAPSRGLGNWLDGGFALAGFGATVALIGYFLLLPLGVALPYLLRGLNQMDGDILWVQKVNVWLGLLPRKPLLGLAVGGSAVAFLISTKLLGGISLGRVSRFFQHSRIVVDIAMDVDNWMRERPVGATPRLRIMARYVSLLRHIADQGYDQVVVVAHSQGCVVTADLFRYLKRYNPVLLTRLGPTSLLTLGCPLRQLYARRFPGMYGWAEHAPLADSGFAIWINGYGSGDYVGRHLWHLDDDQARWSTTYRDGMNEFCVGPIAHIHYFGKAAPQVGVELNRLIA